jgi:hypothetical protein
MDWHVTGLASAFAWLVQGTAALDAHNATAGVPAEIVWLLDVVVVKTA